MSLNMTRLKPSGKAARPLDEIPADHHEAVKEAYEDCKTHDGRIQVEFAEDKTRNLTAQEVADEFLSNARVIARNHTPRLVISGNSTQKGHARFRVDEYVKPETTTDAT